MNNKIIIFGGTKESRVIAAKLSEKGFYIIINVISKYADEIINKADNIKVNVKKMDSFEIENFILEQKPDIVINAAHPYADIITVNLKKICLKLKVKYIRFLRQKSYCNYGIYFDSIDDIISYVNEKSGNVFSTIGSKNISKFINLKDYKIRLFVRVLPIIESINICRKFDIPTKNIVCMYPPYSLQMNIAMFKEVNAKFVITKDTGQEGGFYNKAEAARVVEAQLLILKRPLDEVGYNFDELIKEVLCYEKT